MADEAADGEGYPDGHRAQGELAQTGAQYRPAGEPTHDDPAGEQGHGGKGQGCGQCGQTEQVGQERDQRAYREGSQGRCACQDGACQTE